MKVQRHRTGSPVGALPVSALGMRSCWALQRNVQQLLEHSQLSHHLNDRHEAGAWDKCYQMLEGVLCPVMSPIMSGFGLSGDICQSCVKSSHNTCCAGVPERRFLTQPKGQTHFQGMARPWQLLLAAHGLSTHTYQQILHRSLLSQG